MNRVCIVVLRWFLSKGKTLKVCIHSLEQRVVRPQWWILQILLATLETNIYSIPTHLTLVLLFNFFMRFPVHLKCKNTHNKIEGKSSLRGFESSDRMRSQPRLSVSQNWKSSSLVYILWKLSAFPNSGLIVFAVLHCWKNFLCTSCL